MKFLKYTFLLALYLALHSCKNSQVDLLVTNAKIYTVNQDFSVAEAMAIKDGKILEIGNSQALQKKYKAKETLHAEGKYIYPGFIDAHTHFLRYGLTLQQADLVGTQSWEEVVQRVEDFAQNHTEGWLVGMGWNQNAWENKDFPDNQLLNEKFPDRPVMLGRIDGHALIANQKALDMAGITSDTKIEGGSVVLKNGKTTGVLIDNAMKILRSAVPEPDAELASKALLEAQKKCFAVGLTSVHDAGSEPRDVELMDSLQKSGKLKMNIYALIRESSESVRWLFERGKIKTERLEVRGFKALSDGALGSRGACLLMPYSDQPDWNGFLLNSPEHFDSLAKAVRQHDMQLATHAIGDSANRTILKIYAKYLKGENDLRWRIEHAQIVNENDFHYFKENQIVPSVQPTHATSDMYWAIDRVGKERLKNAYANKKLLNENSWISLGTDFPIEDISPLKTFYAAVFRQDASGFPQGGFQMENALSREEALRGMTIWAAKSAFQEKEKGSLEAGKSADFILLDKDIMEAPEKEILTTKVLKTYINGERVY